EATASGAGWIDEIAADARRRRDSGAGRIVTAHGDWSVKHFRFSGLEPTVVYDWESLQTDSEAALVGCAAAMFTYTERLPVELWPSPDEVAAFLDDYQVARGTSFTPAELAATRGAAVYARAYAARCTHAVGGAAETTGLLELASAFL